MKCVETYDGKEFWINDDKASELQRILTLSNPPKLISINGSFVNANNISGIYDELDMKEKEYRKQGMYICNYMQWHFFKEICHCRENFLKYGVFENSSIKSKQCIEFEKKHGLLELNINRFGEIEPKDGKLNTLENS